jgi:hypothetical protein
MVPVHTNKPSPTFAGPPNLAGAMIIAKIMSGQHAHKVAALLQADVRH